jgi:hypothetical protein
VSVNTHTAARSATAAVAWWRTLVVPIMSPLGCAALLSVAGVAAALLVIVAVAALAVLLMLFGLVRALGWIVRILCRQRLKTGDHVPAAGGQLPCVMVAAKRPLADQPVGVQTL